MPVIQGYVQIENCQVEMDPDIQTPEKNYEIFTLSILSRRSRFRAGTRYKRRGVNENGEVANYVETEQLITYQTHEVSFVQVRGSVPLYWSQPGYKYRPPPRIDKGEAETQVAFSKHFTNEIQKYGPICAVNLIDQTGKEKVIFDAYSHNVLLYNSPFITYVTFDFHEYCIMQVVQQNPPLSIDNLDIDSNKSLHRRHGKLLPNSFRAIFCGPSDRGKTNAALSLLFDPNGARFKNVYVYSKSLYQPKYQLLEEVLKNVKGVGYFP